MSDDATKAEVKALRDLRHAVSRYAEQMRAAMAAARRDATMLRDRAEENLRKRKSQMDGAMRGLQQAQAALTACRDPKQAPPLQRAAAVARARVDETKQFYRYAQQAVRTATAAQSDLLKTMQVIEPAVGEHNSASSAALASIEGKLTGIQIDGVGTAIMRTVTVIGVAAEISLATTNTAKFVQNIVNGCETVDGHCATISEIRTEQAASTDEHWMDAKKRWDEDHSGEVPRP